jgi:glutamate racemase
MDTARSPIGIFDSGIGGIAVLAEVRRLLPHEDIIYYADQAHFPYGPSPREEVRQRSAAVTRELIERGCKLIVVACNTATSAAISSLRDGFSVPFVSIEPALKPAAEQTLAGKVALLMTPGTARGDKLAALIDRYGAEVHVLKVEAPGLADRIESGDLESDETRLLVRRYLEPVTQQGADVLALGCTHYAFIRTLIEEEAGAGIAVLEPSEAVARQVRRVLQRERLLNPGESSGRVVYLTSGDPAAFASVRDRLRAAGADVPHGEDGALAAAPLAQEER